MSNHRITIVGAGLTGIMAARKLKEAGHEDVVLVEKSKSAGGRLATRRVANGRADHGAQFFTVRTDELKRESDDWLDKGWIKQWFGDQYPRYTAVNGMNGLAKRLSKDLDILLHTKVVKADWKDGDIQLFDEEGRSWTSNKVLLTMPVPQIVELVKNSSIDVDLPILKSLHGLSFRPAYVGIYHFRQSTNLPENGHLDQDLPEGIERIVDHRKKGISEDTIVSVYMTGKWSRNHYGEDYVLGLMQEKLADFFDWDELESEQLKRWRYAEAERTLDQPYLDLTEDGRLVAAGDAFLRPDDPAGRTRFESAFLSGLDVANHMREK